MEQKLYSQDYDWEKSGSTANVLLFCNKTLTWINIGDSRAILATLNPKTKKWKSISLSKDHKPNSISEKLRIEK